MEAATDETYRFLAWGFDIGKAKKLFTGNEVVKVKTEPWKAFIVKQEKSEGYLKVGLISINEEHAKATTNTDPIIFAQVYAPNEEDSGWSIEHILIDGNHRMWKALYHEPKEYIESIVLDPEQTMEILLGPCKEYQKKGIKNSKKNKKGKEQT